MFVRSVDLQLREREREIWNGHTSMDPLPVGLREINRLFPLYSISSKFIEYFLTNKLHLRYKMVTMPPGRGMNNDSKTIGEQMTVRSRWNRLCQSRGKEKKKRGPQTRSLWNAFSNRDKRRNKLVHGNVAMTVAKIFDDKSQ